MENNIPIYILVVIFYNIFATNFVQSKQYFLILSIPWRAKYKHRF